MTVNVSQYKKIRVRMKQKLGCSVSEIDRYQCIICGHIYDPAVGEPTVGIVLGVSFDELPDTWVCPICHSTKDKFVKV